MSAEKGGKTGTDQSGKHTTKRPDIQRIIVVAQPYKEFRAFEIAGRYSYIIFCETKQQTHRENEKKTNEERGMATRQNPNLF
jgi:hypothetical protein